MITRNNVAASLKIHFAESVRLKKARDEAKTSTKRNYLHKKLVKNNLVASKLLVTLEKINNKMERDNAENDNADGDSPKES